MFFMAFKHITIAGSGVLGSQIAFQTAFFGYNVTVYDINDEALAAAKERFSKLKTVYGEFFDDVARAEKAFASLSYSADLAEAVKEADLIIEAVPEVVEIKTNFYTQLAEVAPGKTIFASNSSTMLPSQFAEYTGRPEKFLALHFANEIWKNNIAEVMGHAGTDTKYADLVEEFAKTIDMVTFRLHKEQPGYMLNTLLVPFLNAAQYLWANEVADPHAIDKNWMISTGAPVGPFAFLDIIGMTTPYNLTKAKAEQGDQVSQLIADKLKSELIDQGKLGVATGEGFYKYPNPAYQQPDFLK